MYTDESTLNLNRMLVYAAQTLADEEATQEEVDAMTTSVQEAIDALVPVSDASVNGAGTSASAGNASGSVTNTAAQTQTILFAGVCGSGSLRRIVCRHQKTSAQRIKQRLFHRSRQRML